MERTPVWKQGWLREHLPDVREHLNQHWLYYVLQGVCMGVAIWFWKHIPPPGYAIGVTAVLAAVLTFHIEKHPSKWQKIIWFFLIAGFLGLEFKAIRDDRTEFARRDKDRRDAETTQFQGIADDLKKSMRDNQTNFDATLKGLEQGKSTTTGGASFCFMMFSRETTATLGVPLFVSRGQFPLTDVVARIIDLDSLSKKSKAGALTPAEMVAGDILYRVGDIPVKSGSVMHDLEIPISGSSQNFRIVFSAKNGMWIEDLLRRNVDGIVAQAIRVARFDGVKRHVIFTSVDENFPRKAGNVEWLL